MALEAEKGLKKFKKNFDLKDFLQHLPEIPYNGVVKRAFKSGKFKFVVALEIFVFDLIVLDNLTLRFSAYIGSKKICYDRSTTLKLSEYFDIKKLQTLIHLLGEEKSQCIPNKGILKIQERRECI